MDHQVNSSKLTRQAWRNALEWNNAGVDAIRCGPTDETSISSGYKHLIQALKWMKMACKIVPQTGNANQQVGAFSSPLLLPPPLSSSAAASLPRHSSDGFQVIDYHTNSSQTSNLDLFCQDPRTPPLVRIPIPSFLSPQKEDETYECSLAETPPREMEIHSAIILYNVALSICSEQRMLVIPDLRRDGNEFLDSTVNKTPTSTVFQSRSSAKALQLLRAALTILSREDDFGENKNFTTPTILTYLRLKAMQLSIGLTSFLMRLADHQLGLTKGVGQSQEQERVDPYYSQLLLWATDTRNRLQTLQRQVSWWRYWKIHREQESNFAPAA